MEGSCVPSTTLLNFGNVELEEAVQPCDEFLSVAGNGRQSGRFVMAGWSRAGQGRARPRPRPLDKGARLARGRLSRLTVIHPWLCCLLKADAARTRRQGRDEAGEGGTKPLERMEVGSGGKMDKMDGTLQKSCLAIWASRRVVGNQFHCLINTLSRQCFLKTLEG